MNDWIWKFNPTKGDNAPVPSLKAHAERSKMREDSLFDDQTIDSARGSATRAMTSSVDFVRPGNFSFTHQPKVAPKAIDPMSKTYYPSRNMPTTAKADKLQIVQFATDMLHNTNSLVGTPGTASHLLSSRRGRSQRNGDVKVVESEGDVYVKASYLTEKRAVEFP